MKDINYHLNEFSSFYEETMTEQFGDDKELWLSEYEFANILWDEREEAFSFYENPNVTINYSAGVFLGEVESVIGDARFPDLKADMRKVAYWVGEDCDEYADVTAAFIAERTRQFYRSGAAHNLSIDQMVKAIAYQLNQDVPEGLETYGQWNNHLSDSDVLKTWQDSVEGTVVTTLEELEGWTD